MIMNSWKNTTPICEFCDEVMELNMIRSGFQYKCPKCLNAISDKRYELMLDKISKLEDEMFLKKEIGTLEGRSFDVCRGIKCKIIKDDGKGTMSVTIGNIEAISKR